MITGMHAIVFSPQAEKVRAFFADVLGMPSADAGAGWLIFALPRPSSPYIHSDSHRMGQITRVLRHGRRA